VRPTKKENAMAEENGRRSSPLMIVLAWAIVVIPMAWGFSYTLANAMKIFTSGK
jgi:hypothetical protein